MTTTLPVWNANELPGEERGIEFTRKVKLRIGDCFKNRALGTDGRAIYKVLDWKMSQMYGDETPYPSGIVFRKWDQGQHRWDEDSRQSFDFEHTVYLDNLIIEDCPQQDDSDNEEEEGNWGGGKRKRYSKKRKSRKKKGRRKRNSKKRKSRKKKGRRKRKTRKRR